LATKAIKVVISTIINFFMSVKLIMQR
jgi:hypothetical protein